MNSTHQMRLQEGVDWRTERTRHQDKHQYKEVNAPRLEALGESEGILFLHLALSRKHLGINDDGSDGGDRANDGWSLRTEIIAADELHRHGNHSHPNGYDKVFDEIMPVGKGKDDKRQDDEERRQLYDGKRRCLANLRHRCRAAFRHLIAERGDRDTDGTKSRCHRVADQGHQSREHGFESQSDEDGGRNRHRRSEASHAFEQSAESPDEQQHEQSLVVGNRSELFLDNLNLLAFHQYIIAIDSHQDDDEDREHRLQQTFHHSPSRQGEDAVLRMFRGYHPQWRGGEKSQQYSYYECQQGALMSCHLEAEHQDEEQHNGYNRNNRCHKLFRFYVFVCKYNNFL